MSRFDNVRIGDTIDTKHGKCVLLHIKWERHIGPRYFVKFDDGEQCKYDARQLSRIMKDDKDADMQNKDGK